MKKYLYILFFLAFGLFTLYGEKNLNFSITPKTGICYGKIGESLYKSFSDRLVSYLTWDEKPLISLGFESDLIIKNHNLSFNYLNFIPMNCGQMTDSDWKIAGVKTNYSIFENHSNYNADLSLRYFYSFDFGDFSFGPSSKIDFTYRNFSGENGYGWNGGTESWDNPENEKKRYSGINYNHINVSILLEAFGKYTNNHFSSDLFIGLSPFTFTKMTDIHLDENTYTDPNKSKEFTTISYHFGSFMHFSGELKLNYSLNDRFTIYGDLLANTIFLIKGKTKTDAYNTKGDFEYIPQNSGFDMQEVQVNFGIICKCN